MNNDSMALHLKNIFHLVRNYLIQNDEDIILQDEKREELKQKISIGAEKVVIDYIFKNFKNPLRILNTSKQKELINREGKIEKTFIILPIDGLTNYVNGIRLVGFAIAVLDNDIDFGIEAVTHSIIGNIYSGDCFIAIKNKEVYLNENKLDIPPEINIKNSILSAPIPKKFTRPIRKIAKLAEKANQLVNYGSTTVECTMILSGKIAGYIDLRESLTVPYFLPHLFIFNKLGGFTKRLDDNNDSFDKLSTDFNIGYSVIMTIHKNIFERISKTVTRIDNKFND